MKNLILGYPRGQNKWQGLSEALSKLGQLSDIVIDNFDQIKGPYDKIWTMAESLLPLQAKLEQKFNLNNISLQAAEILSDKKKMDDFCTNIGIQDIIPYSVIPKCLDDLNRFRYKPFIIKPTIGSGTKQDYKNKIHYMAWNNLKDFTEDVYSELVFQVNRSGFIDEQFGNRLNYYMAQEYLPHTKLYAPYVYVNEHQQIIPIIWVEGDIQTNVIDQYRFESKPIGFMAIDNDQVPSDVLKHFTYYYQAIVDELEIKNMFFAGPDFYVGSNIKIIDCNPRIGQGLQILNELNNYNVLSSLIDNKKFTIENKFYWTLAKLKPGIIKRVKDMSHLQSYITSSNLKPGMEISWSFIVQSSVAKVGLKISGKTKSDMLETYRIVCAQIQECIEYKD